MKSVDCCVIVDKVSEAVLQCFESPSHEYTMRYFGQFLDTYGKGRIVPSDFCVIVVGNCEYPESWSEVKFHYLDDPSDNVIVDGDFCLAYLSQKVLSDDSLKEVFDEGEN